MSPIIFKFLQSSFGKFKWPHTRSTREGVRWPTWYVRQRDRDRSARPHGDVLQRDLTENWPVFGQPIDRLIEPIEHIEQSRFQSKPLVCTQKTPLSQSWSVWLSEIGSVTLPWPCVTRQSHVSHVKVIKDISGPGWSLNCLVQLATPLHSFTLLYTPLHFYHKSGILQISSSVQILTADCKTPTPRKVSENLFRNELTILLKGCPLAWIEKSCIYFIF